MSKILSEIGFDSLKETISGIDIKGDKTELGMNIAFGLASTILSNLEKCEKDLYKFLSSITGVSEMELRSCSLAEFAELIIELFRKEEFRDFISVVSRLFK